ncbi:MAG: zinc-binding dehydrogenase [Candidatus Omnitrophica bacterium]|nr:zinc-binding dehydrogenase [Candidatus Omnitrophota bacterium]
MKAVVFDHYGGLGVLRHRDVPTPRPRAGEVLIRVEACALNHLDLWVRQGLPGIPMPLPHISGSDVCGTVERLGARVRGVRRGMRVVAAPGIACGWCEFCRQDRDSLCASFDILGLQRQGGYAEYVVVPARNLIPVSSQLSPVEWASVPLVSLTAYHMLLTRGKLQRGETVLIHAAGSGIGSIAIQLAKWRGARVITTVGSTAKIAKARRLGADHVINYRTADFAKAVRRLTQGRGVDLVFEHIGPATWQGSLSSVRKGGRIVTCGATSGPDITMGLRYLFAREVTIAGCYMGSVRELRAVLRLIETGAVKPVVDRVFPLRQAAAAQRMMASRNHFGKLVLHVTEKQGH